MAGPNILVADSGAQGAGSSTVSVLKGARFATQVGNAQAGMRKLSSVNKSHLTNAVVWFKGRLYWSGDDGTTSRVKVWDQSTNTWSDVFTVGQGNSGGLWVVNTATQSYLVFPFSNGPGTANLFARTLDGSSWATSAVLGGGAADDSNIMGIAHGGLLFLHRMGAGTSQTFRTLDPVTLGQSSFATTQSDFIFTGDMFKFDGRLFHVGGRKIFNAGAVGGSIAQLSEFSFGSWNEIPFGTGGYSGTTMRLGTNGNDQSDMRCAAVVVDDATVLIFGIAYYPAAYGYVAWELTLSAGTKSPLVCTEVTSAYIPPSLSTGTFQSAFTALGRGPDGIQYMALAATNLISGMGLIQVVKGSPLQDAGSMGVTTAFSLPENQLDGGERHDAPGTLPLIKPHPLSTAEGTTGLIQTFRVDGDPLIALHGAVAGGPFTVGEAVTWTGGSGVVVAGGVGAAALQMHTIVGADPDGLLMTGGTSGATTTCTTSSGNGQAHTVRGLFFLDANGTGLGAPSPNAPSGYCTMVAGSGVNCVVSKGTGPAGSDEVVTDADDSGQVKSFEWDFLSDGVGAFNVDNVKLQASRV